MGSQSLERNRGRALADGGKSKSGELLALTRADVDLLRSRLYVRRALKDVHGADLGPDHKGLLFGPTKTHAQRTVALPKFLRDLLEEHLTRALPGGSGADALIFPSPTGLPMRHNLFYRRMGRLYGSS